MDVYFIWVFNFVWIYFDGFSWMEVFVDQDLVNMYIVLMLIWNEIVFFVDYVLLMGYLVERYDLNSYVMYLGMWIVFCQLVLCEVV